MVLEFQAVTADRDGQQAHLTYLSKDGTTDQATLGSTSVSQFASSILRAACGLHPLQRKFARTARFPAAKVELDVV